MENFQTLWQRKRGVREVVEKVRKRASARRLAGSTEGREKGSFIMRRRRSREEGRNDLTKRIGVGGGGNKAD